MRFGKKMALWAVCAIPAAATMLLTGVGAASAAPVPHTPPMISHGPHCSPWQRESWNVNGANTLTNIQSGGGAGTHIYSITLRQEGSCVGGTLTDTGLPAGQQNLSVYGLIAGGHITFSVSYGPSSTQRTRTFTGHISGWGQVSGKWTETGTEAGYGTWSLQNKVRPACWGHHGGYFSPRGCYVR